jgi:beta-glucanase (GH16 family)
LARGQPPGARRYLITQDNRTHCGVPGFLDLDSAFHTYKFVWQPTRVSYYIDDVLLTTTTRTIPVSSAPIMINHWGTNNTGFGGPAKPGTDRYVYVDWVRYSPKTPSTTGNGRPCALN